MQNQLVLKKYFFPTKTIVCFGYSVGRYDEHERNDDGWNVFDDIQGDADNETDEFENGQRRWRRWRRRWRRRWWRW